MVPYIWTMLCALVQSTISLTVSLGILQDRANTQKMLELNVKQVRVSGKNGILYFVCRVKIKPL